MKKNVLLLVEHLLRIKLVCFIVASTVIIILYMYFKIIFTFHECKGGQVKKIVLSLKTLVNF
jgi:hypothetical protein